MYMICKDFNLEEFEPWGETAIDTKEKIVDAGKADTFSDQIRELYPDGIPEVTMNDLLWFDRDWCFESVGISDAIVIVKRTRKTRKTKAILIPKAKKIEEKE